MAHQKGIIRLLPAQIGKGGQRKAGGWNGHPPVSFAGPPTAASQRYWSVKLLDSLVMVFLFWMVLTRQ